MYPITVCIIDCTEPFCPRPSSSFKVLFIQASFYIERLDRNRTIWNSNFYQFCITKIYFRQKLFGELVDEMKHFCKKIISLGRFEDF